MSLQTTRRWPFDAARRPLFAWLVFTAALSGCVATAPKTEDEVAETTQRTEPQFDQFATITGPTVSESVPRGMLSDQIRWRVQASAIKGRPTPGAHRLVASIWHQDRSWRFYRSASFVGGVSIPTTRIDSRPSCNTGGGLVTCSYTEVVSTPLSAAQWAEAKASGFSVRLNADRGPAIIIQISPSYAEGFDRGAATK